MQSTDSPSRRRRLLPLVLAVALVAAGLALAAGVNGVITGHGPGGASGPIAAATASGSGPGATPGSSGTQAVGGASASGSLAPLPSGSSCARSGPAGGGYVATICLAGPTPGTSVTGTVAVSLRITVSGQTLSFQRAVYLLDGAPILTAFATPFQFSLDTARWADGAHRLSATVTSRDGFTSAPASMSLTFANGAAAGSGARSVDRPFAPTSGTAPAPGAPFVVAAVGDGASGEKGETQTVNLISSWNPNLFLYLGDVYENGRPSEFDSWYGPAGTPGLYGLFRSITDPTVGNHEYIGNDAPGYFGYWQGIGHYYSFNAGGWHFVSLDSNPQFDQLRPGTGQYDWLVHDLASAATPCVAVYFHHPLFNIGPEKEATQMTAVWQLLASRHVAIILNGHDHDYQRWVPMDGAGRPATGGITEFIVGSGGHGHQKESRSDSRVAASDFTDFGALKLTLAAASAEFQYVTAKGVVKDSGSLSCRSGAATAAPGAAGGTEGTVALAALPADPPPDAAAADLAPAGPEGRRTARGARRRIRSVAWLSSGRAARRAVPRVASGEQVAAFQASSAGSM